MTKARVSTLLDRIEEKVAPGSKSRYHGHHFDLRDENVIAFHDWEGGPDLPLRHPPKGATELPERDPGWPKCKGCGKPYNELEAADFLPKCETPAPQERITVIKINFAWGEPDFTAEELEERRERLESKPRVIEKDETPPRSESLSQEKPNERELPKLKIPYWAREDISEDITPKELHELCAFKESERELYERYSDMNTIAAYDQGMGLAPPPPKVFVRFWPPESLEGMEKYREAIEDYLSKEKTEPAPEVKAEAGEFLIKGGRVYDV